MDNVNWVIAFCVATVVASLVCAKYTQKIQASEGKNRRFSVAWFFITAVGLVTSMMIIVLLCPP